RLTVKKVGGRGRGPSGFRISGEDEVGKPIELFTKKKAAADAIRDVYQDVADHEERLRRVKSLLRWDAESSGPGRTTPVATPPRTPPSLVTEQVAIDLTRRAVREVPPEGRFGPDKVFIAAVYDRVARDLGGSLDQFKRWLVQANQRQVVDLTRADAQGDMDPDLVQRSEVVDRGAAFHFVVDRAAQRHSWN